jgi:hypothetical protein
MKRIVKQMMANIIDLKIIMFQNIVVEGTDEISAVPEFDCG